MKTNLTSLALMCVALLFLSQKSVHADPIREGQSLAAELRGLQIGIPGDISAILKIRKRGGERVERHVQKQSIQTEKGWNDLFSVTTEDQSTKQWVLIRHRNGESPNYQLANSESLPMTTEDYQSLGKDEAMSPVGGSDFWVADLGLDFLHWPDQRIVPSNITMRKGVACKVLESARPTQSENGYYKVRSWISTEYGGVVYAEAFDINNDKIKIFEVNDVEKVDGQWYLKELRIRNLRDRSTSTLEFNNAGRSLNTQ